MTLDSLISNKCGTPLSKGTVQNDATLCKERCDFTLGMSYSRKNLAAQGMYWRVLFWKQISKAMLKLVCWLYSQVLAAFYFLSWFQVTFWEGTQTMRKSWADMGQPLTDLHCFFPNDFRDFWAEVAKTSRKPKKTKKINGGPWVAGT